MNLHAPSLMRDARTEDVLILVDERNRRIGEGGKLAVHQEGLLHRAFSIFLFDGKGDVLMQRRYAGKYHSGGLWANSCCGHPRVGERTLAAATRRLGEEIGAAAQLSFGFRARYRTALDRGLTENELVYVYGGRFDGALDLNPEEVSETSLMPLDALVEDAAERPDRYAYWLRHYLQRHQADLEAMRAAIAGTRPAPARTTSRRA